MKHAFVDGLCSRCGEQTGELVNLDEPNAMVLVCDECERREGYKPQEERNA